MNRRGVLLVRNVGEIQELTKSPRDSQELLLLQRCKQLIQCLPGVTILRCFGAQPYLLDALEQRLAGILPNNFAQHVTQQTHMRAQRSGIDRFDHDFSSGCISNRASVPRGKARRLQTVFNARQVGQDALPPT